jgi:hypothetical protein
MEIETSIMLTSGSDILERFAFAANKTFAATLLQAGRGAVRYAIEITPPASASGVTSGLDSPGQARLRGQQSIRRDLNHAFAPVRLKGKRKERISGAQLVQIHHRLLSQKRPGAPMKRDRGQPYYVDARKLRTLERKLISHVGRLASGWVAAAQALNVRGVPSWVARHGSMRGSVDVQLEGTALYVSAVNQLSPRAPAWIGPETQRRANYAARYALNDLQRQLPHLLARQARAAGLAAA